MLCHHVLLAALLWLQQTRDCGGESPRGSHWKGPQRVSISSPYTQTPKYKYEI